MEEFDRASSAASSRSLSPSPCPSPSVTESFAEDTLYVAVSREVDDSKSVLLWALQNGGNSPICLVHVHQPDKRIPTAMGKLPVNLANRSQIDAHRVSEREKLSKKLDKHLRFCHQHGVKAGKIYIEMDSIQDGILKLITDKKIGKLVMGAAADRRFSKDMIEILSEKAKYVRQNAPGYCNIWFVCKKLLIHTRQATETYGSLIPENIERLKPAPSYEIGGLLADQGSFGGDGYEMLMANRSFYGSTYDSYLSDPSAPDLPFSPQITDERKQIDAWLVTQQMQKPYDLTPSSTMTREAESSYLDELENVKNEKYKLFEQLKVAMEHISSLEHGIEKSNLMVEQLEQRLESAVHLEDNYKKEVGEERKQVKEEPSFIDFHMFCSEVPFQAIDKATYKFDPSRKIGEDAYGVIYKGFFNLNVAVKIPQPSSSLPPQEFQEMVEILYNLRHPNIVNLIGICQESQALIYEYCANGTLEDQLNFKVEGSPLLWQTRIKIATELCIVLMFLHSHKPHPIIHGDLRAENLHLDSNFRCKLNDFSTSIAISRGTFSLGNPSKFYAYVDPEFFGSGELTTKSDVYSFGVILLRLVTGKPAVKLIRHVQSAVDTDELGSLLDPSAGWPLEPASQLAALALRCCDMSRDRRPDLEPDVWNVLQSMKGICN